MEEAWAGWERSQQPAESTKVTTDGTDMVAHDFATVNVSGGGNLRDYLKAQGSSTTRIVGGAVWGVESSAVAPRRDVFIDPRSPVAAILVCPKAST